MDGYFTKSNPHHMRCIAVVFLPLIESNLASFVHYWNTHKIRESNSDTIGGIPEDLYELPSVYGEQSHCCYAIYILIISGAQDYLKPVNWDIWNVAAEDLAHSPPAVNDNFCIDCHQFLQHEVGLDLSCDITESNAFDVFKFLIENYVSNRAVIS